MTPERLLLRLNNMAPKAAKEEDDPAAAAEASLAGALESLKSEDAAAQGSALESLGSLLGSEVGEAAVRGRIDELISMLLKLAEPTSEDQDPTAALNFTSTLAQNPWGVDELVLQGALPTLLRIATPQVPPQPPGASAPAAAPADAEAKAEAPAAAPAAAPAVPLPPPKLLPQAGLACAVLGGVAGHPQGRHELTACGALPAFVDLLEADHAAAPPLDLQAEAALVLARCAESAAARAQLLGHVPQLTRRLFKLMARLDDPAAPPVSMEVEGWVAALRSRLLLLLGMTAYDAAAKPELMATGLLPTLIKTLTLPLRPRPPPEPEPEVEAEVEAEDPKGKKGKEKPKADKKDKGADAAAEAEAEARAAAAMSQRLELQSHAAMCLAICAQSSTWRGVLHAAGVLPALADLLRRAAAEAAAEPEGGEAAPTKGKGGEADEGGEAGAAERMLPLLTNLCLATNHCVLDTPPALSRQLPPFVPLLLPLLPAPPEPEDEAAADAAAEGGAEGAAAEAARPSPLHVSAALCLAQLAADEACVGELCAAGALPRLLGLLGGPPSKLRNAVAGIVSAGCAHAAWRRNLALRGGLKQLCGYLQPRQRYADLDAAPPDPALQLHAVNALALCAVDGAAREALRETPPAPPPPPAEEAEGKPDKGKKDDKKGKKGKEEPPPPKEKPKMVTPEVSGLHALLGLLRPGTTADDPTAALQRAACAALAAATRDERSAEEALRLGALRALDAVTADAAHPARCAAAACVDVLCGRHPAFGWWRNRTLGAEVLLADGFVDVPAATPFATRPQLLAAPRAAPQFDASGEVVEATLLVDAAQDETLAAHVRQARQASRHPLPLVAVTICSSVVCLTTICPDLSLTSAGRARLRGGGKRGGGRTGARAAGE